VSEVTFQGETYEVLPDRWSWRITLDGALFDHVFSSKTDALDDARDLLSRMAGVAFPEWDVSASRPQLRLVWNEDDTGNDPEGSA
jgi:hypothetical protein